MNNIQLPADGSASEELKQEMHKVWMDEASKSGISLNGFDTVAPLSARAAWAAAAGLALGVCYTRFSTQRQGSTEDQARADVQHAARNQIYVPPEYICVDEAKKGRSQKRPGKLRAELILKNKLASVFLVFKLSRYARIAYKTIEFFRESLVDKGLRGIAVSEGIDTADKKSWRLQVAMRGAMDEELLDIIADHVREGLVGLFMKGWVTGALPIGYFAKEVEGAPKTRRNLPRTVPAVKEEVAAMILEHFKMIDAGNDIAACWRKWRRDGGAVDKRSMTKQTSYASYIRMLRRVAYTGRWDFCRKRNSWSGSGEVTQVKQPREEIKSFVCEELRIVPDELFDRVQVRLDQQATGPRPRRNKSHTLWDLVIGLFHCGVCCDKRYYMCGAKGKYMRCKNPDCPARSMVHRQRAVTAICGKLIEVIKASTLPELILSSFAHLSDMTCDALDVQIAEAERKVRQLSNKMADLEDLLGVGDDQQRRRRVDQIKGVGAERAAAVAELGGLQRRRNGGVKQHVTHEQVVKQIDDLLQLLNDAASGNLGAEVTHLAADIFRRLVGDKIIVHAVKRAARKDWIVSGAFVPRIINAVRQRLEADPVDGRMEPITVHLVPPPFMDAIAEEVHVLYDVEKKGFRIIAQMLEKKYGKKIGSGNICAAWCRYYEMKGLPLPPSRTGKIGRPRKAG